MVAFLLQKGWSPLLIASSNGHLEVVKALIEARADVNQANKVHYNTFTHQHKYVCDSIACIHGVHIKINAYVYHVHSCMCSVYFICMCVSSTFTSWPLLLMVFPFLCCLTSALN